MWPRARCVSLVEIAQVGLFRQLGRHGGDVKPEKGAADDGDGRDHVDIADFLHLAGTGAGVTEGRQTQSQRPGGKGDIKEFSILLPRSAG